MGRRLIVLVVSLVLVPGTAQADAFSDPNDMSPSSRIDIETASADIVQRHAEFTIKSYDGFGNYALGDHPHKGEGGHLSFVVANTPPDPGEGADWELAVVFDPGLRELTIRRCRLFRYGEGACRGITRGKILRPDRYTLELHVPLKKFSWRDYPAAPFRWAAKYESVSDGLIELDRAPDHGLYPPLG